jgi:tetratricopeptide (TPR) repeat protein
MMPEKCPECGNDIKPDETYCRSCGYSKTADRKSSIARSFTVIMAVLIVFGAGYFIFAKKPEIRGKGFQHPDFEGNTMESMPDMEQALASLPDDYDGLVQKGNEYMDRGLFPLAIESYRRALAIDSTDVNVMIDLGACRHAEGQYQAAIGLFRKALEIDPDHAVGNFNLGIAYSSIDNMDSTRKYWRRYIELSPESPMADTIRHFLEMTDQMPD